MIPTSIKQAIVIHQYIQYMWGLDGKNRLRVENYKMLKKMIKKFIKVNKDSEECYGAVGITCEELQKDIHKIDRHEIMPVDLEIKTTIHVLIQMDHDDLDPEGMPKPSYYGEVLEELIS